MFATVPNPIPARMKGLNRAEICDRNFSEFVRAWAGTPACSTSTKRVLPRMASWL